MQLVARCLGAWSFFTAPENKNRRKPFNGADFRQFVKIKKAVKSVFDHIFDHLHDHNLITYRGVAQLVGRHIWEHGTSLHHPKIKTAENPLIVRISGSLQKTKKQSNLCLTTYLTTYTTTIK